MKKLVLLILLSCISFQISSCRYAKDDQEWKKEACASPAPSYPMRILLPSVHLPSSFSRIYISINDDQVLFDSCGIIVNYFESPIYLTQTSGEEIISVYLEKWEASPYLDENLNPLENPAHIRAEISISNGCTEDPVLYKVIETNQFTWTPIYSNGIPECGINSQEGLAHGDWTSPIEF